MHKIQKLSRILRIVFQILFILQPIALISFWVNPIFWGRDSFWGNYFIPSSIKILHPLISSDIFYGILLSAIPTAILMLIFYFLIKLFKLYEQGEVFTQESAKTIRNTGIAMLAGQIAGFFCEPLMGVALTFRNPAGYREAYITFNNYNAHYSIAAIMIILVSWIMGEAAKLQEEQKYTV